jgi:RNA polymerase sigma factor (sigma-70 family)
LPFSFTHISDQELLERFRKDQDNQWLGILLERYTLLLFGVCMKYLKNDDEAKDAVQQVFLKAITELHKYDVQYLKSWLYMVARNHCLMKLRERQGKPADIEAQQIAEEHDPIAKYHHLEKDRKLELLGESLEQLNEEQKQCVTLFYLQKMSYHEISLSTGYSVMQVKSHIQNGKRNLKLMVEKRLKNK